MSRRRKLKKFADILSFQNVFEIDQMDSVSLKKNFTEKVNMRGKWKSLYFRNDGHISLELACGRGEYSLALARRYPTKNFIGVDIKGARIWKGAKTALDEHLENVAFVRIRIERLIQYFEVNEVEEIWITFPDPFENKETRRLTSPGFLKTYDQILNKNGRIHLKTDDDDLFEYSLREMKKLPNYHPITILYDIYSEPKLPQDLDIKTYYEDKHLNNNKTIKYFVFQKKY